MSYLFINLGKVRNELCLTSLINHMSSLQEEIHGFFGIVQFLNSPFRQNLLAHLLAISLDLQPVYQQHQQKNYYECGL